GAKRAKERKGDNSFDGSCLVLLCGLFASARVFFSYYCTSALVAFSPDLNIRHPHGVADWSFTSLRTDRLRKGACCTKDKRQRSSTCGAHNTGNRWRRPCD